MHAAWVSRTRRSVAPAVAVFALAGLVALAAVMLATSVVARRGGTDAAVRDARRDTNLLARTAIEPALSDAVVRGEPDAVAAMDTEVRQRVLDHDLVRVKLWRQDGRIVYSDEPRLTGTSYTLGADELASFRTGAAAADVSDLSRPENRFEKPFGKLLEVYQPVRTREGGTLLFETYFRYDAVTAGAKRSWMDFAPIMLLALIGLEALQIPLAWTLAGRVRAGHERQEVLLRRAVDASDIERRRIASDLHDGVVQDLASVSYSLASIESRVGDDESRAAVHDAAAGTRRSIRALRSLLVEIYPPSLREAGLGTALSDLTAPLASQGIDATVDLPDDLQFNQETEALLYRAAQEAVRNVISHSRASHVCIQLSRPDHRAVLEIRDDGVGFDAARLQQSTANGHVGMRVMGDLVEGSGGTLSVASAVGEGTTIHVEVPTR